MATVSFKDFNMVLLGESTVNIRVIPIAMPTFTPPTRTIPLNPETQGGEGAQHSMWRHYQGVIPVGYSVLITSGVATPSPGIVSPLTTAIAAADASTSGEGDVAWFRGGIQYTITSAEDTIIKAAGYTTSTS